MKKFFISLAFVLVSFSFASGNSPEKLNFITEEYAPYQYSENGELKGVNVDLIKLMWKEMGVAEQEIKMFPWARGYKLFQNTENTVLFAIVKSAVREKMFKWVGPIYTLKYVLIGLKDQNFHMKTIIDANNYTIGVIREDVAEQLLRAQGITNLESVSKLEQNFHKLMAKRIHLLAYGEHGIQKYLKKEHIDPDKFETFFVLEESSDYFGFHKNTSDQIINIYQTALDKLIKNGDVERLLNLYLD